MGNVRVEKLRKYRGDYGVDGGLTAILGLVAMGTAGFVFAVLAFVHTQSRRTLLTILELLGGLALLQTISSYLYSTFPGKVYGLGRVAG